MFAYFLGGPLDLTKRAVKQEPGSWLVPVKRRSVFPVTASAASTATAVIKSDNHHEYRLMFREDDLLIYIYQGIR